MAHKYAFIKTACCSHGQPFCNATIFGAICAKIACNYLFAIIIAYNHHHHHRVEREASLNRARARPISSLIALLCKKLIFAFISLKNGHRIHESLTCSLYRSRVKRDEKSARVINQLQSNEKKKRVRTYQSVNKIYGEEAKKKSLRARVINAPWSRVHKRMLPKVNVRAAHAWFWRLGNCVCVLVKGCCCTRGSLCARMYFFFFFVHLTRNKKREASARMSDGSNYVMCAVS